MTIGITIIGLGRIGASIGLALASHKDRLTVTGHDKNPAVAQAAKKLGAVEKTASNLPASVEKADVVILALPQDQIHDTLKAIAQDLREDVLLVDTAPVKAATIAWVKELLPPKRHYVGLLPALNPLVLEETGQGVNSARADLFQGGLIAVSAPEGAAEGAIKLTTDLVSLLGSSPFFADPAEVDGMMACVHLLPQLAAVALTETTLTQPSWNDIRKLAGARFSAGTALLAAEEPGALTEAVNQNQINTIRLLDEMIANLSVLREEIATGERKKLERKLKDLSNDRKLWQTERGKGDWQAIESGRPDLPADGDILSRQFGGLKKLFKRGDKSNEE